ncbi:MAG: adenylosuccinate lyase [Bacteroidales bacterium]
MQGLENISPIDGRYRRITAPLSAFFSEEALIRYRVLIEVEYFIALCKLPLPPLRSLTDNDFKKIREISSTFSQEDAQAVKEIEKKTNHDIKAVEYFIKQRFEDYGYGPYKEFVHFGLTSQDINNTAVPLSLKEALDTIMYPVLDELLSLLAKLANDWLYVPMLAHTHGQPASPTTVGKEMMVFHERLAIQLQELKSLPIPAKFGGATGNFNAHHVAYPDTNWVNFGNKFTNSFGLQRSRVTTQIDHYDRLSAIFDAFKRICTILIDLDRDCWTYISMDYFKQKIVAGEVGSSAMPHKVNPIDFENAEGNAGIATALLEHLSRKLPVSRLQRDLSDSTVLRNIGVPLAHILIALKSSIKGLGKISLNEDKLHQELENNMTVVAEAIQTVLRTVGYPNPYEALKSLTRKNTTITKEDLEIFIDGLDIPEEIRDKLRKVTPFNYTGIIPKRIDD